ncbi:GyrI-like domain-containing protein [bacterium]|nr:GyrI-like domain-containing protein [bacterium]
MPTTDKLDLYKQHKDQYKATQQPQILTLPPIPYLAVDGEGKPGDDLFAEIMGALYGMAYTLKFMAREQGRDYVVAKLEGMWYPVGGFDQPIENPSEMTWQYKLLVRVPEFITDANLAAAREQLAKKKKEGPFEKVHLEVISEGTVVQAMHIGPYAEETPTLERMHAYAAEQGYKHTHGHHEIYLGDPRRVAPEKLKTLLRTPVEKAG